MILTVLVFLACWYVVTLANTSLRLAEGGGNAPKHVGMVTNIIYIYIYIYIYICCEFVGMDNKLYKIHKMYIRMII